MVKNIPPERGGYLPNIDILYHFFPHAFVEAGFEQLLTHIEFVPKGGRIEVHNKLSVSEVYFLGAIGDRPSHNSLPRGHNCGFVNAPIEFINLEQSFDGLLKRLLVVGSLLQ